MDTEYVQEWHEETRNTKHQKPNARDTTCVTLLSRSVPVFYTLLFSKDKKEFECYPAIV